MVDTPGSVAFLGGASVVSGTYRAAAATRVTAGQVSFTPGATVTALGRQLTVAGGTLNLQGAGGVTTTLLTVAGGALNLSASGWLTTPVLLLSGGQLGAGGAVTVTEAMTWTGGGLMGSERTVVLGQLVMTGSGAKDLDATLENRGSAVWQSTNRLRFWTNSLLRNASGATLELASDQPFSIWSWSDTGVHFENLGLVRKSAPLTLTVDVGFANAGALELQAGGLHFTHGGTSSGQFAGAAGTELEFSGDHTLEAGSMVDTPGSVAFLGGASVVSGTYRAAAATRVTAGQVSFTPGATVTALGRQLTVAGGTLNLQGAGGVTTTLLTVAGGALNLSASGWLTTPVLLLSGGQLGAGGAVTVTEAMTWTGGGLMGGERTVVLGQLVMTGSGAKELDATLENRGSAVWQSTNRLRFWTNSLLRNASGATLELASDQPFSIWSWSDTGVHFENLGLVRKSAPLTLTVDVGFANAGALELQAGGLHFTHGGTSSGQFAGAAGTELEFSGDHTLEAGSVVDTPGSVAFLGGASVVSGTYRAAAATRVTAGQVSFTPGATVTALGRQLTVAGGTLNLQGAGGVTTTTPDGGRGRPEPVRVWLADNAGAVALRRAAGRQGCSDGDRGDDLDGRRADGRRAHRGAGAAGHDGQRRQGSGCDPGEPRQRCLAIDEPAALLDEQPLAERERCDAGTGQRPAVQHLELV